MSGYGRLGTEFHDAALPVADTLDVDWYAERLPGDAGPVLAAMCGSGRVLVPLLQLGFHVHGVDSSGAMLAACEARLARAGLASTLFRQELTELNLPFRYGAVFVPESSFQLLADPLAARTALARIRAHLVPPGMLVLDLGIPDAGLHPPGAPLVEVRAVNVGDGARITLRSETLVDAPSRRLDMRCRYERRAPGRPIEREDDSLAFTWYEEADIASLLADSGFTGITIEMGRPAGNARGFRVVASATDY